MKIWPTVKRLCSLKNLTRFVSFLVGSLFIFSGLVKVNDPVGTQIKMKEYFEVFAEDFAPFFEAFIPYALYFAVFMVVFEVILGVALIVGFRMKLTLTLLTVLMVFFTFLTGYSAIYNKVTDCGCFGDAIPLTPWQSFYKDLILSVLIIFIWLFHTRCTPILADRQAGFTVLGSLIFAGLLSFLAIEHLPFIDFRPYKVGNNIPELMKPSGDYIYEYIFTTPEGERIRSKDWISDDSYKYDTMILTNPEVEPKITDYELWTNEIPSFKDSTFSGPVLMVIVHKVEKSNVKSFEKINKLVEELEEENPELRIIAATSSGPEDFDAFRHEVQLAIPYYNIDEKVAKTIVRSNPGLWLLNDGTVKGKWHYNDVPKTETLLKKLEAKG